MTETKLKSIPNKIKGFKWKFKPRQGRDGGGVAIAVREDIWNNVKELNLLEDQEQGILWIEINLKQTKTFVGVYYGKQETQNRETIEREFSQLQTQIISLKSRGEIIIIGDFNAKLEVNKNQVNQPQSANGKCLKEMIEETELHVATLHATKGVWTRRDPVTHKKTVIDYALISEGLTGKVNELIIDEDGRIRAIGKNKKQSDHNTITMSIDIDTTTKVQKETSLNFNDQEAWIKVNNEINSELQNKEPGDYNILHKTIRKAINNNIQRRTFTNKPKMISNPVIKRAQAN